MTQNEGWKNQGSGNEFWGQTVGGTKILFPWIFEDELDNDPKGNPKIKNITIEWVPECEEFEWTQRVRERQDMMDTNDRQ